MSTRAAIYVRISETDERVDKVGNQEADCRALAAEHGYVVGTVYCDDGIGASTFKSRPAFESLVHDAETGAFDVILAVAEDRFSRQPKEKMVLAAACEDGGVVWHTIRDGKVDPATEEGELFAYFRGWTGRKEQRDKVHRQKAANLARVRTGRPLAGVRPFGFEDDRVTHRSSEAELIRWAYDVMLKGGSTWSILKRFNQDGVVTSRGNGWSYATVQQMLQRPRNAGLAEYRGEVLEEVSAEWEPIVSRVEWETVCGILSDPTRRIAPTREPKWLCSGLVRCGVCGDVLRSATAGAKGTMYPTYRCASKVRASGDNVRHTTYRADELDKIVRDAVVSAFLVGPSKIFGSVSEATDVTALQRRLSEVRQGLSNLLDLVGTPGFTFGRISKRQAELATEETRITCELSDHARKSAHVAMLTDSQAALFRGKRVSIEAAAKTKKAIAERFDSLPLEQRRTLVRSLLAVTVHPGRTPARVQIEHLAVQSLSSDEHN